MLVSSSQSSCKKKFCCLLWSDNKLFKLSEEYEVSSSIYRSVNKGAFHVVIDFLLIYGAAGFCRGKTPFQQLKSSLKKCPVEKKEKNNEKHAISSHATFNLSSKHSF